ncbi:PAS domain-containing protein [Flaviaesturariibacter aridisoli]|uniref:Oxygen sensor histidine kinase NreB n=1 Tax=Flaviaesturariibacter aridisoli TaxID=2545761 RepID=A0A4R4E4D8_9BACT|nr:PAS domain-containing protein [Flaviaesturariibacter aridisoli]TCZ71803.1 response regulator [Flaviaesturariibacter aridisoli]
MSAPLSLLIVEDNPGDLLLLKEHLRLLPVAFSAVREAATLAEAGRQIEAAKPDLILLDLFLPDSNGTDTFQHLFEQAPEVPIVVFSGLTDAHTAINTIQQGAQDYIVKGDYDERLLAKVIQYSIERHAIRLKLQASIDRYHLVAKATSDVVWDWDLVTNENWFNENFELQFGYAQDALQSSINDWLDRLHPDDHDRVLTSIHNAINEGRQHWEEEYRFRRADGTYARILDRGYTLYDEQNKPFRMIGSMQDITHLKELQERITSEQVRYQRGITETTIRAQEQERAGIGRELHDNINQILASCKLMTEMALREQHLRETLLPRTVNHLNTAIEEIRKLSRELVPPPFDEVGLDEGLRALIESTDGIGGTHIRLCVNGDAARIEPAIRLVLYRIVQEQLHNIQKYAAAAEATVALSISDASVRLEVSDNGAGFDPSVKKSGIGLRNIRNRAQLHGGGLTIDAAPGLGCTLTVEIPLPGKTMPGELVNGEQ